MDAHLLARNLPGVLLFGSLTGACATVDTYAVEPEPPPVVETVVPVEEEPGESAELNLADAEGAAFIHRWARPSSSPAYCRLSGGRRLRELDDFSVEQGLWFGADNAYHDPPRAKVNIEGTKLVANCTTVYGFSSTSTVDNRPAFSSAILLRIGDTARHGPHHSAQKSTRTGLSYSRTSVWNVASVTAFVRDMLPAFIEGSSSNPGYARRAR